MSALLLIAVGALGGTGAVLRFSLDRAVTERSAASLPLGTLAVNLLGAFCLGVVTGAALGGNGQILVATGLLGAFTTFSTWALESERLGEEGLLGLAISNFALSLVLGIALVWLGTRVGGLL